jgi:putative peptide zinc metalloprotease protein
MSFPAWWPSSFFDLIPSTSTNLWRELDHALDVADMCPAPAKEIVWRELHDRSGPYYVLKNPNKRTYLRLSPREFWLWERMDGTQSIQTLVADYFIAHGTFAYGLVVGLLQQLYHKQMLLEQPKYIFSNVTQVLRERTLFYKLMWPARVLLNRQWAISGLDGFLTKLYRGGGWILYSFPVQIIFIIISVVGLYFFGRMLGDTSYAFLGENLGMDALTVWMAAVLPVLIHEMGHALTVKHYGRVASHGGLMLYFGMPAAFVDTTDIWMEGKRARLAVTWAGPYTGFIIGGLFSSIIWFWPDLAIAPFLFKMAVVGVFMSVLNLNPLLKLDGYYLLSDALEIGRLRERALHFLRRQFIAKLIKRERFVRDEIIFVLFGILSVIWTIYIVYASIVVWNTRVIQGVEALFANQGNIVLFVWNSLLILLALSFLALMGSKLYQAAQTIMAYVRRSNLIAQSGRAALSISLVAVVLTMIPLWMMPPGEAMLYNLTLGVGALSLGGYLAFRVGKEMQGSFYALAWYLLAMQMITFAVSHVLWVEMLGEWASRLDGLGMTFACVAFVLSLRLVIGLRGSWRVASCVLLALGSLMMLATKELPPISIHLLGGLLITGGILHWQSLQLPAIRSMQFTSQRLTAREELWDAFKSLAEALLSQLRIAYGKQTAHNVAARLNRLANARNWELTIANGQLSTQALKLDVTELSELLAAALECLLDEISRIAGRKFSRLALARGYDALNWDQRELVEEYILINVSWATGLVKELELNRRDAIHMLEQAPLFATYTREEIQAVARRMRTEYFPRDTDIIQQGEAGDRFYILRRGRVTVIYHEPNEPEQIVNELVSGDYFGETALLIDAPRNATIRTLTPVEVLSLSRRDFNKLVRPGFTGDQKIGTILRQVGLLRRTPIFKNFPGLQLQRIVSQLEVVKLKEGQTLFQEGDTGDKFYVIESGEVAVYIRLPNGESSEQVRRGPGEYFGEIALLLNVPRTGTVIATQSTTLLALGIDAFNALMRESDSFEKAVERTGSRRVLQNTQAINRSMVDASDVGQPLSVFHEKVSENGV